MKLLAAALALTTPALLLTAAPLAAEDAVAARLNLDSPIETLYADPAGAAVMEANVPGMDKHPMFDMIKTMTLRQIQPMSQGMLTEEMLKKIETELAAIK